MMRDPRQSFFMKALEKLSEEFDIKTANAEDHFLFASSVNLGYLQDLIADLTDKGEINSLMDVENFVCDVVQRIKRIQVEHEGPFTVGKHRYKVDFMTKDDRGYYVYGFSTRITDKEREELAKKKEEPLIRESSGKPLDEIAEIDKAIEELQPFNQELQDGLSTAIAMLEAAKSIIRKKQEWEA